MFDDYRQSEKFPQNHSETKFYVCPHDGSDYGHDDSWSPMTLHVFFGFFLKTRTDDEPDVGHDTNHEYVYMDSVNGNIQSSVLHEHWIIGDNRRQSDGSPHYHRCRYHHVWLHHRIEEMHSFPVTSNECNFSLVENFLREVAYLTVTH